MNLFAQIKEVIPARAVLEHFLGRSRGSWRCPFHEDRTPSLSAYGPAVKCFGCQWAGDIFRFTEAYLGVGRGEALRICADLAGVILPDLPREKRKGLSLPSLWASVLQVRREIDEIVNELEQAAAEVWRSAWDRKDHEEVWELIALGAQLDRTLSWARQ